MNVFMHSNEQGSNVESEEAAKRELQIDYENAKKELPALGKQAKNREKEQARSTNSEKAYRKKNVKETQWKHKSV